MIKSMYNALNRNDKTMTTDQACRFLGLSKSTLMKYDKEFNISFPKIRKTDNLKFDVERLTKLKEHLDKH